MKSAAMTIAVHDTSSEPAREYVYFLSSSSVNAIRINKTATVPEIICSQKKEKKTSGTGHDRRALMTVLKAMK